MNEGGRCEKPAVRAGMSEINDRKGENIGFSRRTGLVEESRDDNFLSIGAWPVFIRGMVSRGEMRRTWLHVRQGELRWSSEDMVSAMRSS